MGSTFKACEMIPRPALGSSLLRVLNDSDLELLRGANFAHFATIGPDGAPRSTVLWVDTDGRNVVVNRTTARAQVRDLKRDPRVSVSVHAQEDPYHALTVQGPVVEITETGAGEHIDFLSRKYTGQPFNFRAGEVRLIIRIAPTRIHRYGY